MSTYPKTLRKDEGETLHGKHVPDPYRWMEDLDSDQTEQWVTAQNEISFGHLKSIPQRTSIHQRIESLWNYEKFGIPFTRGNRLFFTRNDGLQNQSVMFILPECTQMQSNTKS